MIDGNDGNSGRFSSPPCFMHEVDAAYLGLETRAPCVDVARWRRAERERLIGERLKMTVDERRRKGDRIAAALDAAIESMEGLTISVYWPFRGEPDLRGWIDRVMQRGGRCALPLVVGRGQPLVFRLWMPGDALERGVWGIPAPSSGAEVLPDVVIAPVVGFDRACYRLGYGGGFFDRTLAALPRKPRVCGVGFAQSAVRTIYPQPHDIPMDVVVTEEGLVLPQAEGCDGER